MLSEELEGLDALGEDDEAVGGTVRGASPGRRLCAAVSSSLWYLVNWSGVMASTASASACKRVAVPLGFGGCVAFDLLQALRRWSAAGGRAGEEGLFQDRPEQKLAGLLRLVEGGESGAASEIVGALFGVRRRRGPPVRSCAPGTPCRSVPECPS